ncbi:MAG: hypothetical protein AAB594_01315 [Patescibacteria group bacterium]
MDFWSEHGIMFVIGLVLWPRMLLIYFGLIPAMSIPPILGLIFVPRMLLVSILTPAYWDTNSILISICWVLAVILDIIGIIFKFVAQAMMLKHLSE